MSDNTVNCPVFEKPGFEIAKLPQVCPQCGWKVGEIGSREYKQAKVDTLKESWYAGKMASLRS